MPTSITPAGGTDLRRLAATMKTADKDLKRRLARTLKAEGEPLAREVQAAVRALPVAGTRGGGSKQRLRAGVERSKKQAAARKRLTAQGTGLRESIARVTKASARTSSSGVRLTIKVDTSKLPRRQRKLPEHLDNPAGWRHPVFGNREVWVQERGRPWFGVTIDRHARGITVALRDAVRDFARTLT